jgi:hypothetical protein
MSNTDTEVYVFIQDSVPGGVRFEATKKSSQDKISFMMAIDLFARGDVDFVGAFLKVLRHSTEEYKAYYFETPPMTELKVC